MKRNIFKKTLTLILGLTLVLSMSVLNASAAPLKKDLTKGYAPSIPGKNDAGILTYQDFESDTKDEEGKIGKFSATVPDDTNVPPAKIEIVSGVSRSGSKSLKVSARGKNASGDPQGYNTVSYSSIGIDIGSKFIKDTSNKDKTENYYISAWVKNVDPSVTQYFWLQLQYGGSGEVWLPGQTYYEVKGSEWTQIGIVTSGNDTLFAPFIEDSTKSGIYAPRNGVSTWSALKFITKNPKANPTDKNEKVIQTNYDFYVDDIVIWKVDDTSKLVTEINKTTTKPTSTTTTTKTPGGQTTVATDATGTDTTESTDIEETTSTNDVSETTTSSSTTTTTTTAAPEKDGLGTAAIVGIVVAAVALLGGAGALIYWFVLRKKTDIGGDF